MSGRKAKLRRRECLKRQRTQSVRLKLPSDGWTKGLAVAGLRATGIGCFFDNPVHQTFGFKEFAFQSRYHFTIGGPVDNPRLTTLPPYGEHVAG